MRVSNARYEIKQHIARGGMAEVFLARDLLLDRPVALKVLFPEFATDRSFVERFRREARAAANLNHPNIVSVYDWGEEDGTYFIVMEYVKGRSLRQLIRTEGPLHPQRVAEIGAEIASALAFAHQNGVIHRDIKPGNVVISPSGQVKVTDFGIARAAGNAQEALTQTGVVMGTATYFSPEQAQGRPIDPRSDVYALGVVLYEMLAGRPPFYNENPVTVAYQHVREAPVPPSRRNPDVPPPLEAIVLKALAKNPANRYASAQDLRADLLRFRQGRPVAAEPVLPPMAEATTAMAAADGTRVVPVTAVGTGGDGPRRRTGAYVVLLVVLLGLLGGLLFLLARQLGLGSGGATKVAVPSVLGKTEDDARSLLIGAGLKVKAEQHENDAQAGTVYDQRPKPEAKADKGSDVTILVSKGPGQVSVPSVVNETQDQATGDLEAAGLTAKVVPQASDTVSAGQVMAQDPAPGTKVDKGSAVTITVSSGTGAVTVPNVVGKDASDAANILGQAGFRTTTRTQPSDTVAAGTVISTSPGPGAKAPKNSLVTLVVSSGPTTTTEAPTTSTSTTSGTTTVPDVTGKTKTQAKAILQANGFSVDASGCSSSGPVISQNPAGGTSAPTGSTVSIFC